MKHYKTFLNQEYKLYLIEGEVAPGYGHLINWFDNLQVAEQVHENLDYETAYFCVKAGAQALLDPALSPEFRKEIQKSLLDIGRKLCTSNQWIQAMFTGWNWDITAQWVCTPTDDYEPYEDFFEDRPEDASDDFSVFELPAEVEQDDIYNLFQ